ncbi:hypothetical protein C8Q77DRAFT_927990 [Trametes polyzona]|nr:hypothetical protein C8Q77DRAFT_927990 [Trametes polyzona]
MKANRNKLATLKNDEKTMMESKTSVDSAIAELETKIRDEQTRLETRSKEKRDRAMQKLDEINAVLAHKEQRHKEIAAERQKLIAEADSARAEGEQLQRDQQDLRNRLVECEQRIQRCSEMERSKLAQFGNGMDAILHEINNTRWHGQPPVGPFGLYVKVKDPERWARLLRIIIGNAMGSFAITDARDHPTLHAILHKHKNNAQIIIAGVDMFDFSAGEPAPQYLTVLRALEVSDQYVLRQLVNSLHIESMLLAKTRSEADQMLMSIGTGGVAMSADLYRVVRFPEGGGQSSTISDLKGNDQRQYLFQNSNAEVEKRRWEDQRVECEGRLNGLKQRIAELQATYQRCRREASVLEVRHSFVESKTWFESSRLQGKESGLMKEIRTLRTEINNLQLELNEDMPVNIQALQAELQEQQASKDDIMNQYEQVVRQKEKVQQEQRPLMAESESLRKLILEHTDKRSGIKERLNAAVQERMEADNSIKHFTAKADAEREKLAAAEEVARTLEEEFQAWSAQAAKYCAQVPNPRKVDVVQRNLDAVTAALAEREKRQGATTEEIANDLARKKASLEAAQSELKALNSLNNALKRSVKKRLARWHEFRRHIALRCKVYFAYHLSNRGYFGKVLFNHIAGTLDLKVRPPVRQASHALNTLR